MDVRIFAPGRMQLLESLYSLDMSGRLSFNADTRTLYVDLHGMSVTSSEAITPIFGAIEALFVEYPALAKKVDVLANYDGFNCSEKLIKDIADRGPRGGGQILRHCARISQESARRYQAHVAAAVLPRRRAFELLKSKGHSVSRQIVVTLCARFCRGHAKGTIMSGGSEELTSTLVVETLKG
jgi:hypothetical protein